jgi:hypothetical protein
VLVANIIYIFGVSNVNLMRLSQERIIPYFDEGVVTDTKEQMVLELEINRIKFASM